LFESINIIHPSIHLLRACNTVQAGSELAAEKAQFESRLRRIKLACSRWKVAYQKDVHERYQQMASVLEERYMRCAY
jgi:hypothetical protein